MQRGAMVVVTPSSALGCWVYMCDPSYRAQAIRHSFASRHPHSFSMAMALSSLSSSALVL